MIPGQHTPLESQPLHGRLGYGGCSKHNPGKEGSTPEAANLNQGLLAPTTEADGDWVGRSVKSLSEVGSAGAKPGRRRMERGIVAEPKQIDETGTAGSRVMDASKAGQHGRWGVLVSTGVGGI